jgi:phospholipid-binding lipoprotein MlaA
MLETVATPLHSVPVKSGVGTGIIPDVYNNQEKSGPGAAEARPREGDLSMRNSIGASLGRAGFFLGLLVLLSGCATTGQTADPRDPLQGFNRSVYRFNDFMDENLFNPVGRVYQTVTPEPVDRGISNFFSNLADVSVIANDILQFKPVAVSDIARLVFNSTIGLLGFFDVATHLGLPKHNEDFGQTLGVWGIPPGPYLMVPLFGPSTIRDAVGIAIDRTFLSPVSYVRNDAYRAGLMTLNYIDFKADLLSTRDLMAEAAVDPYEFTKNAYLTRRENMVRDRETAAQDFEEIMNE